MSGNCQNNLRWMNGGINDEYSLHQSYSENNSDPDRDDSKQGSAQSSEGKTSTQGDTNDDTTSDDCKPPATQNEVNDNRLCSTKRKQPTNQNKKETSKAESFPIQLMGMLKVRRMMLAMQYYGYQMGVDL